MTTARRSPTHVQARCEKLRTFGIHSPGGAEYSGLYGGRMLSVSSFTFAPTHLFCSQYSLPKYPPTGGYCSLYVVFTCYIRDQFEHGNRGLTNNADYPTLVGSGPMGVIPEGGLTSSKEEVRMTKSNSHRLKKCPNISIAAAGAHNPSDAVDRQGVALHAEMTNIDSIAGPALLA